MLRGVVIAARYKLEVLQMQRARLVTGVAIAFVAAFVGVGAVDR
jgi:hypothetical protein